MIFGRTNDELKLWRRRYALLPVQLRDGRWIWLQHFSTRWRVNMAGVQWLEVQPEPYEDPPPPTTAPPLRR
jgi:hypothetical protein